MLLMQSDRESDLKEFEGVVSQFEGAEVVVSDDPADSEMLVTARRIVGNAQEKYSHDNGLTHLIDDVCVPRRSLAEFVQSLHRFEAETPGIIIGLSAHAGDGNTHPAVFFDPEDETSRSRAYEVFDAIMDRGLQLGGTISGEHGVGRLKRHWFATDIGDEQAGIHAGIKSLLNPRGDSQPGQTAPFHRAVGLTLFTRTKIPKERSSCDPPAAAY